MSKKKLLITLVSGEVIETDLEKDSLTVPFGSPANHPHYVGLCQFIGINGYPRVGEKNYVDYIPPSQIRAIEICFDTPSRVVTRKHLTKD